MKSIADDIRIINQLGGATPMGCGIRLAADQLHNIGSFDVEGRQIINLITDGVPKCQWIPGTYRGTWMGPGDNQYVYGKRKC
ncbi:MAG TPA: hypothetical protein EYP23_03185 [Thermoplasmata archaeon]|nr:hypothetical protein [Thermoplasmata archaeon]